MLDDERLNAMLDAAWELDLFVLLEAFSREDIERGGRLLESTLHRDRAAAGELLYGVNSRNLRTLEVDPTRLERYAPLLPDVITVAESGLSTAADAARMAAAGYRLALVGTALMRAPDPGALIRDMSRGLVAA